MVVTVNLEDHQPQTPLGLILAPLISRKPPLQSHYTILIGWTRPFNKLGIVQKSGQIRIGDRLVEINGISVRNWTYEKIIRVLRCFDDGVRIRSLGFEVLKDESGIQNRTFNWSVARRRMYSLSSFIRSYRIEEDYVQYEIRCELLVRNYQGNDEAINFSIWKRYSEFKALHELLQKGYEWQLEGVNQGRGISFPSNVFIRSVMWLYGSTSERFLERRRHELDDYWSLLQTCSDIFEFGDPNSHRFSKDMADFLSIERHLHSPDVADSIMSSQNQKSQIENQDGDQTSGNEPPNAGLEVNLSGLSDIPRTSSTSLRLDESSSSFGEILVPGGLTPSITPGTTPARKAGSTAKRKKRMAAAKPAFQRRLLDDL